LRSRRQAAIPQVGLRQGDAFRAVEEPIDLIVANPPYLLDAAARVYRHGSGELGSDLSVRIVVEGLPDWLRGVGEVLRLPRCDADIAFNHFAANYQPAGYLKRNAGPAIPRITDSPFPNR
jgi:hypothetical protein